jgi:uncharacterized protein with ParB-like and HNH nuclease domain
MVAKKKKKKFLVFPKVTKTASGKLQDYVSDSEELTTNTYDIVATPNDFNTQTIFNFIEKGAVIIPGFQRSYVWDIKKASRLIESILLGLPVPQTFLYEEGKNKFLVIDGQQRLLSIYFFVKGRFPKKEARAQIKKLFAEDGKLTDEILFDPNLFTDFHLYLKSEDGQTVSRFHGLSYKRISDNTDFDMKPLRNIIIKQTKPEDDDSSKFEIFSRLNTGGVNLSPQEIRASLYHSNFLELLGTLNEENLWRKFLGTESEDFRQRDIELLLRGFAFLEDADSYSPPMLRFLNRFAKKNMTIKKVQIQYLKELFMSFLKAIRNVDPTAFVNPSNNRFNIALFEAVFVVSCAEAFKKGQVLSKEVTTTSILKLSNDKTFKELAIEGASKTENVKSRLTIAKKIIRLA